MIGENEAKLRCGSLEDWELLRALGQECRLSIFLILNDSGRHLTAREIRMSADQKWSQDSINGHLRILARSGLIVMVSRGYFNKRYCVNSLCLENTIVSAIIKSARRRRA